MTVEENVYDFLGVEVKTDNKSDKVTLTQGRFTKKFLKTPRMLESNKKITPSEKIPLGIDAYGPSFGKPWEYDYVVLMLIYLSSNSKTDTHFAVHYYAMFTHNPRSIHAEAGNRI